MFRCNKCRATFFKMSLLLVVQQRIVILFNDRKGQIWIQENYAIIINKMMKCNENMDLEVLVVVSNSVFDAMQF